MSQLVHFVQFVAISAASLTIFWHFKRVGISTLEIEVVCRYSPLIKSRNGAGARVAFLYTAWRFLRHRVFFLPIGQETKWRFSNLPSANKDIMAVALWLWPTGDHQQNYSLVVLSNLYLILNHLIDDLIRFAQNVIILCTIYLPLPPKKMVF